MKKFTLSVLSVSGLLLASCGGNAEKNYIITAQLPDSSMDSTTVYLQNILGEKLDSTMILNNQLKFEHPFTSSDMVMVALNRQQAARFVLEPTEIIIDFSTNTVTGGELNKVRADHNLKKEAIITQIQAAYQDLTAKLSDEKLDDAAKQELQKEFSTKLETEYQPQLKELDIVYFNANKNNILAIDALTALSNAASETELEGLLSGLDATVATHPLVKQLQDQINVTKKTAEGEMFTDFTIDQGDGTSVSLSDYVGKGKYVLVDFWASWCPPCRAEIPNLAEVYKKYKGDKFELLSVAVWDKIDDSKKAIEELKMTWPQIINGQKIPTDLYGIKGIPQIILFGPDGTIIKRNLRGEEIGKTLAELLK